MYESQFGITRSPFQLTPDPWFYFGSGGHQAAARRHEAGLRPGSDVRGGER